MIGQTFQYFQNETLSELSQHLQKYSIQARLLYQEITQQELIYQSNYAKQIQIYNQLKNTQVRPWLTGSDEFEAVQEQLLIARANLQLNSLYIEGYKLLNEIGEYFHGQWDYSITLFDKTSFTFQMNMEDFLSIAHATVEGFRLNDKQSIFNTFGIQTDSITGVTTLDKMKATQVKKIQWDTNENKAKGYNTTMFRNYNYAISRAQAILTAGKASNIARFSFNAGERLEGYLSYIEQGHITEKLQTLQEIRTLAFNKAVQHLGATNFNYLYKNLSSLLTDLNLQTNQRGFWSGGDTPGHGQIKGENATVFSFNTIKIQLLRISQLFNNINFDKLLSKRESVKNMAIQTLDTKTKDVLKEVISVFDNRVLNVNGINLLDEINACIDNLI